MKQKAFAFKDICRLIRLIKDKKTVLVGGCFDILHFGHIKFLQKAKQEGEFLIIAIESDEFIRKNKRENPIHSQKKRAEILANLGFVDIVLLLPYFSSDKKYFELVKIINPNIIAITEGDPQLKNKKKQIESIGGKLKIVTPLLKQFSTRKLLKRFVSN